MIPKNKASVKSKKKSAKTILKNFLKILKTKKKVFFIFLISFVSIFFLIILSTFYYLGYFKKPSNGFLETAQYLNSLPKTEKIQIWSNSDAFCKLTTSHCLSGKDLPEYAEFDFFVFFTNQDKKTNTDNETFTDLKTYSFKKIEVETKKKSIIKAELVKNADIPREKLPPVAEFSFAIIGDSQRWAGSGGGSSDGTAEFRSILANIKKNKPDFLLAMGDLTPDYLCENPQQCKPHFEAWKNEVQKYVPIIYPAFGNHDEGNKARFFWKEVFDLPENGAKITDGTSYSFNFKNSQFTFIDSEKAYQQQEGTEQMEWLRQELLTSHQRNKFVISHATDFNRETKRQLHKWKTLVENGVFAQFSGHTHVFCYRKATAEEFGTEGNFINIFIIGNSGSLSHPYPPDCESKYKNPHFAIVKIKGSLLSLTAYDSKGNKIDTIESINPSYFY